MIITLFRSRLKPESIDEYSQWAERMSELAKTMPGYIAHKGFIAEDGERITVVEFEDEASQRNWSANLQHVEAKKGRKTYSQYRLESAESSVRRRRQNLTHRGQPSATVVPTVSWP
jgi:heme-degrading monooxygenase HmoA